MEEKYTITLNKKQLEELRFILERDVRDRVGQLHYGVLDYCRKAIYRHYPDASAETKSDLLGAAEKLVSSLSSLCWRKYSHEYYGLGYSPDVDMIWDMVEVLRYQLWKENDGVYYSTVDSDKPFHWNKNIDLIEVNKITE